MGLKDKFKSFMGIPEEEDYFDEIEPETEDKEYHDDNLNIDSNFKIEPMPDPIQEKSANKVVNIGNTAQMQVVLVKPEKFEDVSSIADHLISKHTVVINMETVAPDLKRRMLDFLSGVAYVNDGKIKKIASCTYIITPYNVGIIGDEIIEEIENNNSVYF